MGAIHNATPVRFLCGLLTNDTQLMILAETELSALLGPVDATSSCMPFDATDYYRAEMGPGLIRKFVSFANPRDPADLADIKIATNRIEDRFAQIQNDKPARRINLDPGYLTPSRLVLASTKDFSHRIYLRDGIYAEVTLLFRKNACHSLEWTFPDFRGPTYHPFFLDLRQRILRNQ